jgi:protein transport protein SEC61 subunit gamma-like protein
MGLQETIASAYSETKRILRCTRKPKKDEYGETAKITGLGIIVIGAIGFIVFLIAQLTLNIL